MKIEKLTFSNINSLAGEFHIDFLHPELAGPGIFVITGPTGAGKSSILDAISFALYGRSPRQQRFQADENEIMTHGAASCSATVQYEQGGEHYLSTVSQARSKRGSKPFGQVKCMLYKLSAESEWELLANKKSDFDRLTARITGLSYENFTRCMLLAQGDFAVFLKAGEKERAEILSTITGTEIYRRIGDVAHERVAAVQQQIDALQALPEMDSEQRLQVEQARDNAEHTLQELAGSIARVKSCRKWLEDLAKKTSAVETARQKATEAAHLLEIFMQAEAVELRRAEAALAVKPAAAALQAAETRLSKHSKALECAARLRETATTKLGEKNTAAEAARRQQQSQAPPLEEALAAVRGQMRPQEAALALLRESAGRTRKTAGEKAAELRKVQEEHKRLLQNEEELRQQLEKLHRQKQEMTPEEGLTERLPLLQARLEDWKKAPLAAAELPPHEELEADLQNTHQAVDEAGPRLATLRNIAELLRRRLGIEDQLAALYLDFREGRLDQCPCCGATVPGERRAVMNEEVQAADNRVADAEKQLKNARAKLAELTQLHQVSLLRRAFCDAWLQPVANLAEAQKLVQSLMQRREAFEALLRRLESCEKQHSSLVSGLEASAARVEVLRKSAEELQQQAEEASAQYNDNAQIFIRRWGSGNTADALEKQYSTTLQQLASAVQAADTELQRCKLQATEAETSFAQLEKQLPEISDTLQHCKDNFTTLLTAHHFADKADYMAAETLVPKLPLLREKQRRLTEEAGTTAAVARSGESELEGMLAESPLQEGETAETLAEQEASLQTVQEQNRHLLHTLLGELHAADLAHRANQQTAAQKKQLEAERERHALLKKVLGDSRDGFRKFAQQITFDMLLRRANAELRHLTNRYELRRRTTADDPLGLAVIDRELGITEGRNASNLSGGESFLVSLALALGLSRMSGTTRIDSLFLDEGFGTLDADTLQHVLSSLQKLRSAGKMIGIISHVPALSEQIPARIQVTPRRGGFSTLSGSAAVQSSR